MRNGVVKFIVGVLFWMAFLGAIPRVVLADMTFDEFLNYSVTDLQARMAELSANNASLRQKCDSAATALSCWDNGYSITTMKKILMPNRRFGAEMIRLLIVEDQPAVRQGLQMRLSAESDFEVIGEASDGEAALALVSRLCPDVVVLDVEMPYLDGIATTRALLLVCPSAEVIILSLHDDANTQARAKTAGAAAFVAKSMPSETLLTTIRQVAH